MFIADPDEFLGIGIDVASGGEGETEGRGAEDVGDEAKCFSVPGVEIRAGTFLDGEFESEEGLFAVDGPFGGALWPIEPMDEKRIERLVFADSDLDGKTIDGANKAEFAGLNFDAGTDAAGVRAIADEADFDLSVGVAALVAQIAESAGADRDEGVGIAIQIEVGETNFGNVGQLIQAELRRAVFESGETKVAPGAKLLAEGPEVEPAVVVVIDGAE